MASPKKWNDASFPEIDFADILDSEEAGIANDAGSQKVWKKGTLKTYVDGLIDADITTHEADMTSVHGIADTSLLLDTADIGVSVQAYDVHTVKKDEVTIFTERIEITKNLADGIGILKVSGTEPDIIFDDTDGGFNTLTFRNSGVGKWAFGRSNVDRFYIARNIVSEVWDNDVFTANSSSFIGLGLPDASEKLEVVGNVKLSGVLYLGTYTVSTLPTATVRGFIFVSDETGGATTAFSDGTNWRRSQDRVIVS